MIRFLSGLSILFLSISAVSSQDSLEKGKRVDTIKAYKEAIKSQQLYAQARIRIFDLKDSLKTALKMDTLRADSIKKLRPDTGKIR